MNPAPLIQKEGRKTQKSSKLNEILKITEDGWAKLDLQTQFPEDVDVQGANGDHHSGNYSLRR